MTRKHFEAIAFEIRLLDVTPDIRQYVIRAMANVCKQYNGRFDTGRFTSACTPDDEK